MNAKRKGGSDDQASKRQRTVDAISLPAISHPSVSTAEILSQLTSNAEMREKDTSALHQLTHFPDEFLPMATTIVKHSTNVFVELRCSTCQTNTNTNGDALLKGWKGMFEHILTEHNAKVVRLLRSGLRADFIVFSHCTYRKITEHEVKEYKAGSKTIELIKPQRGRDGQQSYNNSDDDIRELVMSLQSPNKVTTNRSRTRSPRRLLTRTCFLCEQKIAADVSRLACKHCTLAVCMPCKEVLEVDPAHSGCKKEPEEHSMRDFELQEPSAQRN